MSPKKKATEDAAEDRRAEDQDAAVEAAAEAGDLPSIDRRMAATVWNYLGIDTVEALEAWLRVAIDAIGDAAVVERAYTGSQLTKTARGWQMQLVGEGGTTLHLSGPTFSEALGNHGRQVRQ